MKIFNALRDFAEGLCRGLLLFVTERNEFIEAATMPGYSLRRNKR